MKRSIWDNCSETANADAKHRTEEDAKLREAALRLGFSQSDSDGAWEQKCPHCGGTLVLKYNRPERYRNKAWIYGEPIITVFYRGGPQCSAYTPIEKWLKKKGYITKEVFPDDT